MGYSPIQYMELGGTGTSRCTTSAEALPDQPAAKAVLVRALSGNAGSVFVGISTVTNTTGADNSTTGLEIAGGQETPWIPCPPGGLAGIFIIGSAVDQDVTYIWLR